MADGEASLPALKRGQIGVEGLWGWDRGVSWFHVRDHCPALPFNSDDQSAADVAFATVRLNPL